MWLQRRFRFRDERLLRRVSFSCFHPHKLCLFSGYPVFSFLEKRKWGDVCERRLWRMKRAIRSGSRGSITSEASETTFAATGPHSGAGRFAPAHRRLRRGGIPAPRRPPPPCGETSPLASGKKLRPLCGEKIIILCRSSNMYRVSRGQVR